MTSSYAKLLLAGGVVFLIAASLTNAIMTGHFFGHHPEPKIWSHIKAVIIVGFIFLLRYLPVSERDEIKPGEWFAVLLSAAIIGCVFDIFPR